MPARQDPDTSRVFVNRRVGKVLEWARWVASILLLPLMIYMLVHYAQHKHIEGFMDTGPRFTGTAELPNANALRSALQLDILQEILSHAQSGPHAGVNERLLSLNERLLALDERLLALEKASESQDRKLDEILRRLPR